MVHHRDMIWFRYKYSNEYNTWRPQVPVWCQIARSSRGKCWSACGPRPCIVPTLSCQETSMLARTYHLEKWEICFRLIIIFGIKKSEAQEARFSVFLLRKVNADFDVKLYVEISSPFFIFPYKILHTHLLRQRNVEIANNVVFYLCVQKCMEIKDKG